jgi:hypothetical protein
MSQASDNRFTKHKLTINQTIHFILGEEIMYATINEFLFLVFLFAVYFCIASILIYQLKNRSIVKSEFFETSLQSSLNNDTGDFSVVRQLIVESEEVSSVPDISDSEQDDRLYIQTEHSLRRKPKAFLQFQFREDLLPNDQSRRVWQQLLEQFKPDEACRLIVESLYIAAVQDSEYVVGLWLEGQLRARTLNLKSLKQKFASIPVARLEVSTVNQHPLEPYDQLLQDDQSQHCRANFTHPAEVTTTPLHAATMAGA